MANIPFLLSVSLLVRVFLTQAIHLTGRPLQNAPAPKRDHALRKRVKGEPDDSHEDDHEDEEEEDHEAAEHEEAAEDEDADEHGHGHGHGHGHHGHGDDEPLTRHTAAYHTEPTETTDAVSVMLLAMFTFQISLFYMVNHPNKAIQGFTWQMMSAGISIFAAILLWTAITVLVEYMTSDHAEAEAALLSVTRLLHGHRHDEHGGIEFLPLVCLFFVLFGLYHLALWKLWRHTMPLKGFAAIGSHTMGFAAVQVLGTVAEEEPWNSSWPFALLFSLISFLSLMLLNLITTRIRKSYLESPELEAEEAETQELREQLHKWDHVYTEAENEFAAFAIGLMFVLTIQFMITGKPVPYHGNPYGLTDIQVSLMFLTSAICAVLMVFIITRFQEMKSLVDHHHWHRASHLLADCVAFCFGWSFLFAARCFYWHSNDDRGYFNGDQMSARVIQALALTFVTIVVILLLKGLGQQFLGKRPIQAFMTGFGLMLGLSWEGAFYNSIEDISEQAKDNQLMKLALGDGIGLGVCVLVLPAWYLYVFPKADEAKEHDHHKLGLDADHGHDHHGHHSQRPQLHHAPTSAL